MPYNLDQSMCSHSFLQTFKKITSNDKLSSLSSASNSSSPPSLDLENKLSKTSVRVPYLNGAQSKEMSFKTICQLMNEINENDKLDLKVDELQIKSEIGQIPTSLPTYQVNII